MVRYCAYLWLLNTAATLTVLKYYRHGDLSVDADHEKGADDAG